MSGIRCQILLILTHSLFFKRTIKSVNFSSVSAPLNVAVLFDCYLILHVILLLFERIQLMKFFRCDRDRFPHIFIHLYKQIIDIDVNYIFLFIVCKISYVVDIYFVVIFVRPLFIGLFYIKT